MGRKKTILGTKLVLYHPPTDRFVVNKFGHLQVFDTEAEANYIKDNIIFYDRNKEIRSYIQVHRDNELELQEVDIRRKKDD